MNSIYNYFKEINKLNETIRTGWIRRNVPIERLESVSEHIFTTSLLALAVIDKYDLKFDNEKVLKMILIHELGEIDVGDIPLIDIEQRKDKHQRELNGIIRISKIINCNWIVPLWEEFESKNSEEAKFVYKMDRLNAILQSKYYSELTNNHHLFEEFYRNGISKCEEFSEICN